MKYKSPYKEDTIFIENNFLHKRWTISDISAAYKHDFYKILMLELHRNLTLSSTPDFNFYTVTQWPNRNLVILLFQHPVSLNEATINTL
jgi:hypothetical protein